MKRYLLVASAVFTLCVSVFGAKPKEEPFVWPDLPDAATKEAAGKLKSDTGLVIIQRLCKVQLNSFYADPYLIKKEEFLRFLILNEEGAKNANIGLVAVAGSVFSKVEGRTIAPDGTITPLDRQKDVQILTAKGKKESEKEDLGGTANYPAPVVGAILDLHFIAENKPDVVYFYAETLLYNLTTTLKADLEIRVKGGIPSAKWNIFSFGMGSGGCKLESLGDGGYAARMGAYQMETHESNTPPPFHVSPYILCYMDFSDIKVKGDSGQAAQRVTTWDSRGRIQGIEFPAGEPSTKWWIEYASEYQKYNREFLKKEGPAAQVDVTAIAPADLPLEERLKRLYTFVQDTVKRDPDAERIVYLYDMMKRGANSNWQGTLFYSYLLNKAGIGHKVGLVADRYEMRYSPLVKNGWLYDFDTAIVVEGQGAQPFVLQPGDFSLDFGVLPFDRQDAMVFTPQSDGSIKVYYSPVNALEKDLISWHYKLEMDASGGASGTIAIQKNGAAARGFRRWYILRELHFNNPDIEDKEKESAQDRKKKLDEEIEDAFWIPGEQFTCSEYELARCEQSARTSLEVKATATGKAIAQVSGNRLLVSANPLMAGYKSGYNRPFRKNPIWNGSGGKRVVEGELLLPIGAKVLELPKPQEVKGPDGMLVRYAVEQVERDGRIALKSRMEYDFPLIVGSNLYSAYKTYVDAIARLSQDRCIVELSGEKELE